MTAPADPPSGRALDRKIHLRIFGHSTQSACPLCPQRFYLDPSNRCPHVPPYSSDIRAAWLIIERMLGRRVGDLVVVEVDVSAALYDPEAPTSYTCTVTLATPLDAPLGDSTVFDAADVTAETMPLAICSAALAAIEGRGVDG